jgi:hypothetical protein
MQSAYRQYGSAGKNALGSGVGERIDIVVEDCTDCVVEERLDIVDEECVDLGVGEESSSDSVSGSVSCGVFILE